MTHDRELADAASDLLAALKGLIADYDEAYGGDSEIEPTALKQARAAIAKAEQYL